MKLNEAIDLVFVRASGLEEKPETIRGYENSARQFCLHVRNPEVELITAFDVERYLKECEEIGFKRNTLNHRSAALRTLFRKLRRFQYRVLDPADIVIPKREFRVPRVASDEHIDKFLEQLSVGAKDLNAIRNRAMVLFLRDTGMRVGELISLNIPDLDLASRRTVVKTEKSRGMRPVRLVCWYEECSIALQEWLDAREALFKRIGLFHDPNALFIGTRGWRLGYRLTNSGVGIAFRKISTSLNPHSLRHRKGHMLAKEGANNSIISGVLGHSSLSSSYIYTMLNDHELEQAARAYGEEKMRK